MTPLHAETDHHIANRNAALRWGSFVVGMLSLQVICGVTAIILASGDKSVAIVPGYHEKAIHWDDEVAIRNAAAQLGWVAEVKQTASETNDTAGLQIRIRDRSGQFVVLQSGTIEIYRHARALEVRRVQVPAAATAAIELSECFNFGGLWQVSLDVRDADGNRFVDSQEIVVGLATSDEAGSR